MTTKTKTTTKSMPSPSSPVGTTSTSSTLPSSSLLAQSTEQNTNNNNTTEKIESPPSPTTTTVDIPKLKVLFQSKDVAVVVKPPGIPCHAWEFRRDGSSKGNKKGNRKRKKSNVGIENNGDDSSIPSYTVVDMARVTFFPKQDNTNGNVDNNVDSTDRKIHLVHRLDAPTSGCLLLAFNADAAKHATDIFHGRSEDGGDDNSGGGENEESGTATSGSSIVKSNRTSHKTYFALCRGDGEILRRRGHRSHSVGMDTGNQRGEYFIVDGEVKDAKGIKRAAQTKLRCWMGSNGQNWKVDPKIDSSRSDSHHDDNDDNTHGRRCCLVEAVPLTGRFHQIRSHLGREHHPLVGETKHHKDIKENRAWKAILDRHGIAQRPCLHCHRLIIEDTKETGIFGTMDDDNDNVDDGYDTEGSHKQKTTIRRTLDVQCPLPDDIQQMIRLTDWAEEAQTKLPQLFVSLR